MKRKSEGLTERQLEVMALLIEGYTIGGIAEKLFVTKGCVNLHCHAIYKKLGFKYEKGRDQRIRSIMKYLLMEGKIKDVQI